MKLKVYGGHEYIAGKPMRAIVAAHSMKEVARIIEASVYEVRTYWEETHNEHELKIALTEPGVVFVTKNHWRKDGEYRKMDDVVAEWRAQYAPNLNNSRAVPPARGAQGGDGEG